MIQDGEPTIWHRTTRRKVRGVEVVEETKVPVSALGYLWSTPMTVAALATEAGLDRNTTASRIADGSIPTKECGSMLSVRLDVLVGYRLSLGSKS